MLNKIAYILISFYLGQVVTPAEAAPAEAQCQPVGKLAVYSGRQVSTQPVCPGERPALKSGNSYEFLCYVTSGVFSFIGARGVALPKCESPAARRTPCPTDALASCTRKGPGEDANAPRLILPYGKVLTETRPLLKWTATPGATQYVVKVAGPGVDWGKIVINGTALPYPAGELPLKHGNVYTVGVVAHQDSTLITSLKTLTLLSQSEVQRVKTAEEHIKRWGLSLDDTALELEATYVGRGLLDEAIMLLKSRVQRGSRNPQLHQKLGDRYLEADLPELAQNQYEQAKQLAQRVSNLTVVAQAEAGLQKVAQLKASFRRE